MKLMVLASLAPSHSTSSSISPTTAQPCYSTLAAWGSSKVWLKSKNPASEAVRREREENWGKTRRRVPTHGK
jgi:hypothetical protein